MKRIKCVLFLPKSAMTNLTCSFLILSLLASTYSQLINVEDSLNSFGISLLEETMKQAEDSLNLAVSPYTVWTLMNVLLEGSVHNTAQQLESTLRLPTTDKNLLRNSALRLSQMLQVKSEGVTLEVDNAIFTNNRYPVKKSFKDISQQYYGVKMNPIDFDKPAVAAEFINKYVARATRNRITLFVTASDVEYAQVFMSSILYFKGSWNMPFQKNATQVESFYDEENKKIGEVQMMFQVGEFPFVRIDSLNCFALELPYGRDKRMSMVIVLPFKGERISEVLNLISNTRFYSILENLDSSFRKYPDERVYVYLPRFKVDSSFNLKSVLSRLGIKDVFDYSKAELTNMFDSLLYLSTVIQKARIDVDEEGSTAASAVGVSLINKSSPPKFRVDRPFLYFIVDKPTRAMIFAGKLSNPNTIKNS